MCIRDRHYHITSGDTEQVTEKLDKGIIDFAVLAQESNPAKYHSLKFPDADLWGIVMPAGCPIAERLLEMLKTAFLQGISPTQKR